MKLFKPSWVSHGGKPLFAVDIHPDGSRFATGGQGDNSGRVTIWNMVPVLREVAELDDTIPKMFCQMDNHLACVNCVRWSRSGKYLASGGDDRLVMIWQQSRLQGTPSASAFGGGGAEMWRGAHILRGHSGDILDLAWSPSDQWLASCSVDNLVVIWNAHKFPEQVAILRGHVGLVKGITWDPVGKYIATQSDDKTLRIWRTVDWQEEACVKDPFKECAGVTHVLRLEWSPDGQYVMSAHASNNGWPTTQIVERNEWRATLDFVGHRKAVTCVRFSPQIFTKTIKKNEKVKDEQYMCCALGSRDKSLSFWLTCLKRPLAVVHDLFRDTIVDISWNRTGFQLLCCSIDGTVAFVDFSDEEIGKPLSNDQMAALYQQLYGSSLLVPGARQPGTHIIESAAVMELQQKATAAKLSSTPHSVIENGTDKTAAAPPKPAHDANGELSNGGRSSSLGLGKQIETRTKDGKRRITPILLSAPGDLVVESAATFMSPVNNGASAPMFSTSTEHSKIVVEAMEAANNQPGGAVVSPSKLVLAGDKPKDLPVPRPMSPLTAAATGSVPSQSNETVRPESKLLHNRMIGSMTKSSLALKRKFSSLSKLPKGNRGRPRKDRPEDGVTVSNTETPVHKPDQAGAEPAEVAALPFVSQQHRTLLPVAHLQMPASLQLEVSGGESGATMDVENNIRLSSGLVHRLTYKLAGRVCWEVLVAHPVIACVANRHVVFVACEDHTVSVFSTSSGSRHWPPMMLDSRVHRLQCSGHYVAAITSHAFLYAWNVMSKCATIKKEAMQSILQGSDKCIDRFVLTEQGVVGVSLTSGCSYTFNTDLSCWLQVRDAASAIVQCSDFRSSGNAASKGALSLLCQPVARLRLPVVARNPAEAHLQQEATASHLEVEMLAALSVQSPQEYHHLLLSYVRHLANTGNEVKLRAVCTQLLTHKGVRGNQSTLVHAGMNKQDLLREILPIIGSNLALQRLYTEFHDQLE